MPLFASQIDGAAEITSQRYAGVLNILEAEQPDVLLTQWRTGTYRDHRVCANLVYGAWLRMGRNIPLHYYEVMSGGQTRPSPRSPTSISTTP